jgi:hypothetical protein
MNSTQQQQLQQLQQQTVAPATVLPVPSGADSSAPEVNPRKLKDDEVVIDAAEGDGDGDVDTGGSDEETLAYENDYEYQTTEFHSQREWDDDDAYYEECDDIEETLCRSKGSGNCGGRGGGSGSKAFHSSKGTRAKEANMIRSVCNQKAKSAARRAAASAKC